MTGRFTIEDWSFPPNYNPEYLPDPTSKYWFPLRETMPPEERNALILERLKQVTRYAYDRSAFYRRHWDKAGFHPDHLKSLEDFEEKVPVITKKDLRESQARVPSFGDYLCIPEEEIHHIHGTSGTTGQPTAFAVGRGIGRPSATPTPGSCGAWDCGRETRSSSPPSSASTGDPGEP